MSDKSMKAWRLTVRILRWVAWIVLVTVAIVGNIAVRWPSQAHPHLSDSFSLTMAIITVIACVLLFVSIVLSEVTRIPTHPRQREHRADHIDTDHQSC